MLAKMRCRVCDAEGLVAEAATDGELVCERCAESYNSLLEEIASKARAEDGKAHAEDARAAAAPDAGVTATPAAPPTLEAADENDFGLKPVKAAFDVWADLSTSAASGATSSDATSDSVAASDAARVADTSHEHNSAAATVPAAGVSLYRVRPAALALTSVCLVSLVFLLSWMRPSAEEAEVAAVTPPAAQTSVQSPASAPAAGAEVSHVAASHAPAEAPSQAAAGEVVAGPVGYSVEVDEGEGAEEDTAAADRAEAEMALKAAKSEPEKAAADAPRGVAAPAQAHESHAPESAAPVNHRSGAYTVQVGSYPDISEANERAAAVRSAGFEARVASVQIPRKGTWHRVQTGSFQSRDEAARYEQRVRASGATAATLVTQIQD